MLYAKYITITIATYGCEAWTLGKTILKGITAFEMKCYRKILKISWTEHRTNKSIRDELKLEDQWLENFIKKQKLKYFGHLKKREGLGKIMLEGKIEGKRERGRPRGQSGKGHSGRLRQVNNRSWKMGT